MNEKQQEAITEMNNVLLIAGAGSGKTYTIVNKVNYIIENRLYKRDEILVISFTNESVNELISRLKYKVDVKTFHKLGLDILKRNNYQIAPYNLLSFIVDEYLQNYQKNNKTISHIYNRIKIETDYSSLKELIITFINLYKSNYTDIYKLFDLYNKNHFIKKDYLRIILEIYQIYQNELTASNYLDFNDMLIEATKKIQDNTIKTKYKYIIIDEFQDTSQIRFNLIMAIIRQNSGKLFAVGDDYQSIYRFNGCNLDIFLNIDKFIPNINIMTLDYNYRNVQTLINISNSFIEKNKKQIKKDSTCQNNLNKPIVICFYNNKKDIFDKVIKTIDSNVLVLGRYNNDLIDYNIIENEHIRFLTIHSAKGLEDENVIIANLENSKKSLPSKIKTNQYLSMIINKDEYPYEEERRLFYVALTRSKNKVYLLVSYNNYSIFVKELIKDYKKNIEFRYY